MNFFLSQALVRFQTGMFRTSKDAEIEVKARNLRSHNEDFSVTLQNCVLAMNKEAIQLLSKDNLSLTLKRTFLKMIQLLDQFKGPPDLSAMALTNLACFYLK